MNTPVSKTCSFPLLYQNYRAFDKHSLSKTVSVSRFEKEGPDPFLDTAKKNLSFEDTTVL